MDKVSIANLALTRIGAEANVTSIDPPEGSALAKHCATFYPIARDTLLEMHYWRFATTTSALALISTDVAGFAFSYARPSNALEVIDVLYPASSFQTKNLNRFLNETRIPYSCQNIDGVDVILTNIENAQLKYVFTQDDPTKYSSAFCDSLAWLIAENLCGTVIKGDVGVKMAGYCRQMFINSFHLASYSDARQEVEEDGFIPESIGIRRG